MNTKIFAPLLLVLLSGCDMDEMICAKYRNYVADPARTQRLVDRLDAEIFSRTLTPAEVGMGSLAGPGRAALRGSARKVVGDDFSGDDIQLIGDDKFQPDAVFIEQKAYHGMLVVRAGKERELKASWAEDTWLRWANERVAVECYHEP